MSNILFVQKLGNTWQTLDPFLFSVHHLDYFPKGNKNMEPVGGLEGRNIGSDFSGKDGWSMYHGEKIPGFPYHPHRGFETITIVEQGFADHSDSLGSTGRFGKGDVQWMTAGKGVQHSEMFVLRNIDAPNTLELFQIWLNLPRKNKMVEPDYKMLWHEDIPVVKIQDTEAKTTQVKVIAGNFNNAKPIAPPKNSWAADAHNHLAVWLIQMEPGATLLLPVAPKEINRALYFYKGETLLVDEQNIENYHSIQLKADKKVQLKAGEQPVSILLLQGKPIGEPVVQYGPFVMNSEAEIQQAFMEYRATEFGGWPWPDKEFVHPREKGRFAKYPDGTMEQPD